MDSCFLWIYVNLGNSWTLSFRPFSPIISGNSGLLTFLSYFSSPSLSVIHLGDFFGSLFLFNNSLFSFLPNTL